MLQRSLRTGSSTSSGRRSRRRLAGAAVVCNAADQQLPRVTPPQRPRASALPQRPTQPQEQQQQSPVNAWGRAAGSSSRLQGQLLSRPQRQVLTPQEQQQQDAARARVVLDDSDPRLAAFDQLVVQVTQPAGVSLPRSGRSFNQEPCRMRRVMAAGMQGLKVQRPTPLQGHAIPAIRGGHDVLIAAPPGAGSSTAALLGVLSAVLRTPRSVPHNRAWPLALLLCPTRELALQQAAQASKLVAGSQLAVKCVTGQAPIAQQVLELRRGAADLLVATPGRLLDLLGKRAVSLGRVKFLVLEEVDELLGPALLPLTKQLLHHPTMTSTSQHQVIALGSAALPQQQLARAASDVLKPSALHIRAAWQLPQQSQQHAPNEQQPQSQQQQQQALLADPVGAGAAAAAAAAASVIPPHVAQRFLSVAPQLKLRTLLRLLAAAGSSSSSGGLTLVLANSARAADDVCAALTAGGVSAGVLHAGRSQVQREEALQCFRFGVTQVLVVCGSVYRGLDLPDVSLVVNYEVPLSGAEYARRVGRAGREGRPGSATTLVTPADAGAVGPLVALLRAGAHVVPEWLGALADGSSASAAMEGTEASAAAPAGEASNSSSGGSDAGSDAGSSSLGSRRQQQQQPSALFSSLKQQQQFGGYTRRPKRQAAASPESSPGRD